MRDAFLWLFFVAVWVCAVVIFYVMLACASPIQAELKRVVPPLWRTPMPTPDLAWLTPSPTNTPRPTPTSALTPTPELWLRIDEIDTVAALVAYEARGESLRGQRAVAYVLLHRSTQAERVPSELLTRKFFGIEVGVEHLAEMKEWWKPDNNNVPLDVWQQTMEVAIATVNGWSHDEFPTSTHFYSQCILKEPPVWAKDFKLLGCIGCHCFYEGEVSK